ncbi:MAG: type II toxin-antitoxin system HicA family toxin [Dehalococcoidia bacterium]|nr:type II toxin-antitoxin system HicA family toxin [Dehalococcoidia bacterium]
MTNRELVRKLKKKGIIFLGHDKKHDVYYNPATGGEARILRHWTQQVDTGTLKDILDDLGVTL